MKLAISYSRWSTPTQSLGDSQRRQLDAAKQYCVTHGLTLLHSFVDAGLSAYRGRNVDDGALAEIIQATKDGHIPSGTVLIIESLDRISRQSPQKALRLLLNLLELGLVIVTLFDGAEYSNNTGAQYDISMRLMGAIMVFARSHNESDTKSKRLTQAWLQKHNDAESEGKLITKSLPSWVTLVDGTMVINEHGEVIKKIVNMMLHDNMGCHTIAKVLNETGVPCGVKAKIWTAPNVRRYLTSSSLSGKLVSTHNGREIDGYYPALITPDEHARLRTIMSSRQLTIVKGNTNVNWLSGLLHCECGSTMFRANKSYVCKTRYQRGKMYCNSMRIQVMPVSTNVALYLSGISSDIVLSSNTNSNEIMDLNREKERLEDLAMQLTDNHRVILRINELSAKIKQLIAESDKRLVPMQYSINQMVKLINEIISLPLEEQSFEMYMKVRPHIIRVVSKIVIHYTTYINADGSKADRPFDIYLADGEIIHGLIDIPIQGDNNNIRIAQAIAGDTKYKIR